MLRITILSFHKYSFVERKQMFPQDKNVTKYASGSEFGGVVPMKDMADKYPPHLHVPAGPELAGITDFNENDAYAYPANDTESEVSGGFLREATVKSSSYKNRKYQQRWRPHNLNRPRTLSLFRLLLCFFQAQILLTLSVPFVAADPAVGVPNVVDHGDIMVSSLIPWLLVQFEDFDLTFYERMKE